jgi:deoxyadenosine/deoxycytidine kinase
MGIGNFHIGIMGNLFSGKTTLMNAMTAEPYRSELQALVGGAELYSFTERVEKDSLTDRCLKLFYQDRVANIFATEVAFLNMRVHQQREIRHLMTREAKHPVIVLEDRPFLDGPEVFVRRMIDTGEMPPAHADLYYTLFYQTLHHERIRLPDLTVYLRTEPDLLEKRRKTRAKGGDAYAKTISLEYLRQIHDRYETLAAVWRETLRKYQELTIVPPDADIVILPAEIDMDEHPDYVHVALGTIREKVRRMIAARKATNGNGR